MPCRKSSTVEHAELSTAEQHGVKTEISEWSGGAAVDWTSVPSSAKTRLRWMKRNSMQPLSGR